MLGDSFDVRSLLPSRSREESLLPSSSESLSEEDTTCSMLPTLTWHERLLGCATCMVAGYILSFGSLLRIKDLLLGNPIPFVMTATIGNIIALCGSCFLSGPRSQVKKMWHATRRVATAVYLGSLALTVVVAFSPIPGTLRKILLLVLMIFQYVAIFWYCLSYIPFAREAVKRYCCRRWDLNEDG